MNTVDSESTVDFEAAAQRLAALVARVGDGELGKPTPCPAYTLGDLIDHIGGLALAFTAAARKETGGRNEDVPSGVAARLPSDWRTRIPRDLEILVEAWRRPGAWSGTTRIAGMDSPAGMVGITLADELAVHGWDVARATGQPYTCDLAVLEAARTFLGLFASPDAPAGPDVPFGPSREHPAGAPLLDQVVSLAGRNPEWSPA